jgi:hemerythrin-like domain-containing protein
MADERFATFTALLGVHAELDQLFLAHQEALVAGDLARALDALADFRRAFELHARQEDERMLPLFDFDGIERRDRAEVFSLEHARLRELVARATGEMEAFEREGDPTPRRILRALEREASFKHLLEHHDARERSALYPRLDLRVDPGTRRRVLDACEREWAARR